MTTAQHADFLYSVARWLEVRDITGALHWAEDDDHGNVCRIAAPDPTILLCAHFDKHPRGIGYDDAVGCAIIERICLDERPLPVYGLFTDNEETGGYGALEALADLPDTIRACLVLDRCSDYEIVNRIHATQLCPSTMAYAISTVATRLGYCYDITHGSWCDAEVLAKRFPTVNLSIGVHEQHTPHETLNLQAAIATADLVAELVAHPEAWLPEKGAWPCT